ncbi:MAG: cysteine-S-conjugate beta-lyase [Syntrophus sp. SKADARSKE-3]|nr:cysteine-S-conjugate beta-lyase [Syntrophus sp. SKADARSKE-3]
MNDEVSVNRLSDDFGTPVDRSGTSSAKWDRYGGRDVIPLWVADMDFRAPQAVIEALHERVSHGIFGYTHTPPELVEAVRMHLRNEYGWPVEADWLVWLPGVMAGVHGACRAVGHNGDEIITFPPVYPPFLKAPDLSQRSLGKVFLRLSEGKWGLDMDELTRAITPRTRSLLFCSPHNPVGRIWNEEELHALADLALRHNLIIISDEIHAGLVLDEKIRHVPIATLSRETALHTITIQGPSKTFNIPGLECAFAVITDPMLRRTFQRAMRGIVPSVNLLGYTAAASAYLHGEPWRQKLICYLRGNRDFVKEEVGKMPGLSMTHVEATYLAWIDTRQTGIELPAHFFERAGVGLSDGADFGAPGFVRLNFACPRSILAEALQRMRTAITDYCT